MVSGSIEKRSQCHGKDNQDPRRIEAVVERHIEVVVERQPQCEEKTRQKSRRKNTEFGGSRPGDG